MSYTAATVQLLSPEGALVESDASAEYQPYVDKLTDEQLQGLFDQVVEAMRMFARAGYAHGDLSPYNLLVHRGRIVVIDLPQIVDAVSNPNGLDLLHRDCENICDWFARKRVPCDAEELFAQLLAELY